MARIYEYKTPGTPGFNIIRPQNEEEQISNEDQKICRSGVGTLLHFIKYPHPDIANAVRELLKCMDKATPAAFKEMKRVMRFILSTKNYGLKINPQPQKSEVIKWQMKVYTDSDWAGDMNSR
jgi:hypothetical protein